MAPSVAEVEYAVSELPIDTTSKQINGAKAIAKLKLQEDEKHDLVLRVYRCLIADLCEQFNGGHPGYA
jgi:dihydroxyacetone synthase